METELSRKPTLELSLEGPTLATSTVVALLKNEGGGNGFGSVKDLSKSGSNNSDWVWANELGL